MRSPMYAPAGQFVDVAVETTVAKRAAEKAEPTVGLIMGSDSDWQTMSHAAETLRGLGSVLALRHPRAARLLQVTIDRCPDPAELSDVLCAITHDDPALRQELLETSSVPARLDKVVETLGALMLEEEVEVEPDDTERM